MGQRQSKKRPSSGHTLRNALLLGGVYAGAGALARHGYRTAKGNKVLRASIDKMKGTGKAVHKVGRWKGTHSKVYPMLGKSGKQIGVTRRGLSAIASTVKRRRSTAALRKTTIKAGPAARSAFKKAPRNVARGKVRSPSYAITKRRR
jgi:hypothetical protein